MRQPSITEKQQQEIQQTMEKMKSQKPVEASIV
jgi:hypothetical protein